MLGAIMGFGRYKDDLKRKLITSLFDKGVQHIDLAEISKPCLEDFAVFSQLLTSPIRDRIIRGFEKELMEIALERKDERYLTILLLKEPKPSLSDVDRNNIRKFLLEVRVKNDARKQLEGLLVKTGEKHSSYDVLCVSKDAKPEEIDNAYKALKALYNSSDKDDKAFLDRLEEAYLPFQKPAGPTANRPQIFRRHSTSSMPTTDPALKTEGDSSNLGVSSPASEFKSNPSDSSADGQPNFRK